MFIQCWGESTLGARGQLGQFHGMCIKYTLANVLHLKFWISFLVFRLDIFIFTKLILFNIILKKK
jgi:hypothetical protein